ncbi:nucleotidyltransferase family protein [Geobacter pelophilus]|uniref:Nucleotidyltransferase family protein n=1 Tax=Geoanaerobacter pelophilus TaxID=60036 RepID=A0AAW4L7D9_9BACT|nr:nucleotidyltransferase family protein [Geoanaerobacter pelophilus]MBT0664958.1 nucleotidyltransferase family protein [Geoanaerobacter pelophilus]
MSGSVAAIVLAAGQSTRMGRCKQLLPLGETTVIGHCLNALMAGGAAEIVVVVSETGHEVAEAVRDYPARVVVNHAPGGDMSSSVRTGRDSLAREESGVIVHLCDYPLVAAPTISSMILAHRKSPDSIIIPCNRNRRGHPLLFPLSVLDELGHEQILRDLVRREPNRIICIAVEDPGVLLDMDTPEDYRRICDIKAMKGA